MQTEIMMNNHGAGIAVAIIFALGFLFATILLYFSPKH